MTEGAHCCAATDCDQVIRAGLLMCPPHWRVVPRGRQIEVYRTWRAYQAHPGKERWAEYLFAVAAAVAAVASLRESAS